MKKVLSLFILLSLLLLGSNISLPLFASDLGDLLYTLDNPNGYGTPATDMFSRNAVSNSDNYTIVGAYSEDESGYTSSGKAYIFDNSDGSLLYTLNNPNDYGTPTNDNFGFSVAISDNYAIVGARQEDDSGGSDSGKAYIYDNSDGTLLYTLDNPNDYGTSAYDYFGYSVSISDNYAIVGAYGEDDSGGSTSGKAYIYDNSDGTLLYTLDNPNAYGTSADDRFGFNVSISDSYAIVGANQEDESGYTSSGKAYIFDTSDGSLLYTLNNPNDYSTPTNDNFGYSVSISDNYAIVGAYGEGESGYTSSGRAYIYDNSDGTLLYTLDNPNGYGTPASDYFGFNVAISDNYAIVGAMFEDDSGGTTSGKAYIFDTSDGSLLYTLNNPNDYSTSGSDYFSVGVGISNSFATVGAWGEDESGYSDSGRAYVFYLAPVLDYFTTSFNSNGGSAVDSEEVADGELATEPVDPTKTDYAFVGWYSDVDLTTEWDFSTDTVTEDITLYAKWELAEYTITFNSNGGSVVADITLVLGTTVTPPDDPTKAGNIFVAWYSDVDLTDEYTFSTMTEDVTLYARWVEGGSATGGLTNNFAFVFIAILLFFATIFLRFKTGIRVWSIFSIGILVFLAITFSGSIPMIIVFVGFIIYLLYDMFLGGK